MDIHVIQHQTLTQIMAEVLHTGPPPSTSLLSHSSDLNKFLSGFTQNLDKLWKVEIKSGKFGKKSGIVLHSITST